jgi:hypothetical protein
MTFTDLEYMLMVAVAVLMWRNRVMYIDAMKSEMRANKYADFLIKIAKGEGTIVQKDNGAWTFKPKEKRQ